MLMTQIFNTWKHSLESGELAYNNYVLKLLFPFNFSEKDQLGSVNIKNYKFSTILSMLVGWNNIKPKIKYLFIINISNTLKNINIFPYQILEKRLSFEYLLFEWFLFPWSSRTWLTTNKFWNNCFLSAFMKSQQSFLHQYRRYWIIFVLSLIIWDFRSFFHVYSWG